MNKITLPEDVRTILLQLKNSGHKAYAVGGCVRDSLLGLTPHDYDICTSATPQETEECFRNRRVIETGIKHGTVTVLLHDEPFEITTFRIDGNYTDGRHPETVSFTSDVEDDLARRDFTINAMATDGISVIDPFGGQKDLANGIVRCVGNPDDRFGEDALRLLRALRFASTYDFNIDPDTADSIHRNKTLLDRISRERVQSELVKMLNGKHVFSILHDYSDVITQIIPELTPAVGFNQNNRYHCYTVYDHIAHSVENYHGTDPVIKMTMLLHDIGKPSCYTETELYGQRSGHFYGHAPVSREMAEPILERLRFDNKSKTEILTLIGHHDTSFSNPSAKFVRRQISNLSKGLFEKLLEVRYADITAHSQAAQASSLEKLAKVKELYEQIKTEDACFKIKDLAINGNDLLRIGYKEGPQIGKALQRMLDAVLDDMLENNKETLKAAAEEILASKE